MDDLKKAIGGMERRKYATRYQAGDKALAELMTAREAFTARGVDADLEYGPDSNSPPDIVARVGSYRWGVEVTELVSRAAIEVNITAKTEGGRVYAVWTAEKIASELQTRIAEKDGATNVAGGRYDRYVLVIHTDEPDIDEPKLLRALEHLIVPTQLVQECWLMFYRAGSEGRHVVLPVRVEHALGKGGA